jgi:FemAB-related protein (PEP-CTERM system-associated)
LADEPARRPAWNAFVRAHPEGTPFHTTAWGDVVERDLGHRTMCLLTGAREITGVLPLYLRESRLFGRSLVSVPAANSGGLLASDSHSARALLDGATALARSLNVAFVELRGQSDEADEAGFVPQTGHVTVRVPLDEGAQAVESAIRGRLRKYVRAGKRAGLTVDFCRDTHGFYGVYLETMRRLGSPPFAMSFFAGLLSAFGDRAGIAVVRSEGEVVAADLFVQSDTCMYSLYAGSRSTHRKLKPNVFLVHAELLYGCRQRLGFFDLGRSPADSPSLQFKLGWGGQVVPLNYATFLHRANRVPQRRPDAFPWRTLSRLWGRLPNSVVTRLGPRLVRHLH